MCSSMSYGGGAGGLRAFDHFGPLRKENGTSTTAFAHVPPHGMLSILYCTQCPPLYALSSLQK